MFLTALLLVAMPLVAQDLSKKPERQELFSFGKNEVIYYDEYLFRLAGNSFNYACGVYDTVQDAMSLIINGGAKLKNGYISSLDPDDFSKSVYTYTAPEGGYISIDGRRYGPYKEVYSCLYADMPFTKGRFVFSMDGETYYVHDYDAKVYRCKDGRYEYGDVKFAPDFKSYSRYGRKWTLPLPDDFELRKSDEYPMNIFSINERELLVVIRSKNWNEYRFIINSFQIDYGEYYDEIITVGDDYAIVYNKYEESVSTVKYEDMPEEDQLILAHEVEYKTDEQTGQGFPAYEFMFNDRTDSHWFFASWRNNYVSIDGVQYGQSCPIEAMYDENGNAFVWFSIEDGKMVRYTFKL